MKIFTNATIIPIEGDIIENGILIIDNGKIRQIGKDIDLSAFTDAEIIDCAGKFITPGLIDAHSHVGLWEEGAGPGPAYGDGNEMTDPVTPHLRALDSIFPEDVGFEDARLGGVTTMGLTPGSANLFGGQFAVAKSVGNLVDTMVIKEPAGLKMALGENPKRVGFNAKRAPNTRMANAQLIRKAFFEAIDYRTEWKEYTTQLEIEKMKPLGEHKIIKKPKFDMTYDILVKVLNKEMPVRMHSHRADDIQTAIRLAKEFDFDLVVEHATEGHKIAEFIAENDVPVIVGPLMTSRTKLEVRHRSMTTPHVMMEAGALVCITCDAPVIPIWMLRESVILAVREGLPRERALETITINAAKVLKVDDRVGSLKVGKDADLVIYNGDPLDALSSVLQTYIDGNLVFEK